MKKRTRTILFVACVVLFCLTAPTMIFYSQGFRFDFEQKRLVQTGGLYFKVLPADAEVYIDGKFESKTAFFTNSLLIEKLLPKTYQVEIKKPGYHAWSKTLEVKEREVTDAKNIVLINQSPTLSVVATSTAEINSVVAQIETSATSSDKKKVIEANEHEIWIWFPQKQNEQSLNGESDRLFLTRFSEKIGQVLWLNDYYLIFTLGEKIKIVEIDERDRLNMVDVAEFENPTLFWDRDTKELYVLSANELYLLTGLLP